MRLTALRFMRRPVPDLGGRWNPRLCRVATRRSAGRRQRSSLSLERNTSPSHKKAALLKGVAFFLFSDTNLTITSQRFSPCPCLLYQESQLFGFVFNGFGVVFLVPCSGNSRGVCQVVSPSACSRLRHSRQDMFPLNFESWYFASPCEIFP